MDGTDKTKRMFIMTENSEFDINEFMLNRPSRIYYHFKYKKLDEASVTGYCKDHDVRKEIVQEIVELSRRSKIFSFDMLQSIVEEHLRFDCSVEEAAIDLNIDTREDRGAMMEVTKIVERATEIEREIFDTPFVTKPDRFDNHYVYIKVKNAKAQEVDRHNMPSPEGQTAEGWAESVTKKIAKMNDAPVAEDSNDENQFEEIYVRDEDLAYESGDQLVYETDEYTFVARNVPLPKSNYNKFF